MNAGTVVTAVAFAVVVAGCASMRTDSAAACNEHVCHVAVHVNECAISVDPDALPVDAKNVEIHWDIESPGYTFPADGIRLKEDDPSQEFSHLIATPNGRRFMANDKNSSKKTWLYGVKVMKGGVGCPALDPSIVNNG